MTMFVRPVSAYHDSLLFNNFVNMPTKFLPGTENVSLCPADFTPPTVCGDDVCQQPQTADSCEQDWALGARCGDHVCHITENADICPSEPQSLGHVIWRKMA